ncbi:hypothetical protein MAUB_19530 [Mycolicibacterium aubagnense]|uniref:Uncharacterized protein n=1 Tax=Mycolicibacterium aubagnense TaxID=319707 RepID=A0ABN5YQL1_9MYCO|nr:hypothetical protein MAUB_19530 [Mycolicibacterium aubagnense]
MVHTNRIAPIESTSSTTPVHAEIRTPRIIINAAQTTHRISKTTVTEIEVAGAPALTGGGTPRRGFVYCANWATQPTEMSRYPKARPVDPTNPTALPNAAVICDSKSSPGRNRAARDTHQPTKSSTPKEMAYEYKVPAPALAATRVAPETITALGAMPAVDCATSSTPVMLAAASPVSEFC